eukprot:TRINITY_DN3408_c0_g4_i1.p1 TRINITY_DN3408_c0_g4~~TRINITY_DN3408_c0_g4_i1.p1  ORF type:complete len:129 (-),score=12.94 TRINITY_DN3408_c0_g4_i1:278-664(-)
MFTTNRRPKSAFEYQHRGHKKRELSKSILCQTSKGPSFFLTEYKPLINKRATQTSNYGISLMRRNTVGKCEEMCVMFVNEVCELYKAKCKDLRIAQLADQRQNFASYCHHNCRNGRVSFKDVLVFLIP